MSLDLILDQFKKPLKKDLNFLLENIFDDIANRNEKNPFTLRLALSQQSGKALGDMFDENDKVLDTIDAGAEIQKLFQMQLDKLPKVMHKKVYAKLGNRSAEAAVVEMLVDESLLIRYNEDFKLVYFKVDENGMHPIDIDYFFEHISF